MKNANLQNTDDHLFLLIEEGNLEQIKQIVENGYNLNTFSQSNLTPLMQAALLGNIEIVRFLCKNGADINLTNKYGEDALMIAEKSRKLGDGFVVLSNFEPEEHVTFMDPITGEEKEFSDLEPANLDVVDFLRSEINKTKSDGGLVL